MFLIIYNTEEIRRIRKRQCEGFHCSLINSWTLDELKKQQQKKHLHYDNTTLLHNGTTAIATHAHAYTYARGQRLISDSVSITWERSWRATKGIRLLQHYFHFKDFRAHLHLAWILRLAITAPYAMIGEHSFKSDCFYPKNNHDHSPWTSETLQPGIQTVMIGSQVHSLINKRHLSLIFKRISTHKTEAHTNALHLTNLRINCYCRQTWHSCDHRRKPEKNQTSWHFCCSRWKKRLHSGNYIWCGRRNDCQRLSGLPNHMCTHAFGHACFTFPCACVCPTSPLTRTCISPSNHQSHSHGWIKALIL